MPIQIRCTCQQILAVDEAHQGQVVGCPYCGTQLTVPVMQQHVQQPAPGYAPPGYPQQPPANFPPQQYPGQQPGWQNPAPQPGASGSPNNPFPGVSAPAAGNPFAGPQAPAFPEPAATSFPSVTGPVSNAPSMPFLAMDVAPRSGSGLDELTRVTPNVPGGWDESAPEDPRFWHIPCPDGHILETPEDMLDQEVLCPYCEKQFTLRKFQSVEETEKRERLRAIREEKQGKFWLNFAIVVAAVVILGVIVMIAISASK